MNENKTYKVIIPYTESAAPLKKFKVEYTIEANSRTDALKKAEKEFNLYSQNTSASWIRIADQSSIRIWRVFKDDPLSPDFIDKLIQQIPCNDTNNTINILKRLGQLEDSTASSIIISQTKVENPEIVTTAINSLGEIGDPTSFFAVKNAYFQKTDTKIKIAVVNNLIKLALPEDNVIKFYNMALKDKETREFVFKIESPELIPLWLSEIKNENEFELVKSTILKIGEKALNKLINLNTDNQKILTYAIELVKHLKPLAEKHLWEKWPQAINKYNL